MTVDHERVQKVRDAIWKAWKEVRELRGKKKTLPIFGVEMFLMELGVAANGMIKKEDKIKAKSVSSSSLVLPPSLYSPALHCAL